MTHNLSEWKKQQRKHLLAAREAISQPLHQQWSQSISTYLTQGFPQLQGMTVGIYWPFRGEYDPRLIARHLIDLGTTLALPEVTAKNEPLHFREWSPDAPMKIGLYDIPVPTNTRIVKLDAAIIPMVGFDRQGYRLGYGSGYYDRTLATYSLQPLTIGVAFEMQRLKNIHPQSHDIAMQYIVTEIGIFRAENHQLREYPLHPNE